jgi:hypothetical protein
MFINRRISVTIAAAAALSAALVCPAAAQPAGPRGPWADPAQAIRVSVASGVPLSIVKKDAGRTRVQVQGSLMIIELHCDLTVRNESSQYLRGVTFAILTDPLATGGRATVALPSLHVEPDGTFPARLNLRLLRPLPASADDVIEVNVDGVLMADLSFHGPDRFNSRRRLTVWEMEADRDRDYFKSLLALGGRGRLQSAMAASIKRQLQPRIEARPAEAGTPALGTAEPGTAVASTANSDRRAKAAQEQQVALASVNLAEAPLEVVSGSSAVEGATAQSPRVTVKNRSPKRVRYFEIGWLVSDAAGNRYAAGWVPGTRQAVSPGETASTVAQRAFVFQAAAASAPRFAIGGMSGYVSQVEFDDGSFWVPSRRGLEESKLLDAAPVSAEEQRLTGLYTSRGLNGVIQELEKF